MGINAGGAALLRSLGVRFPSSVAGMVLLFTVLLVLGKGAPAATERLLHFMKPATRFLGRWMALFFVPPLAVLPAADLPGGVVLGKIGLLLVVGFLFTLVTTAYIVQGLAYRRNRTAAVPAEEQGGRAPAGWLLAGWSMLAAAGAMARAGGVEEAEMLLWIAVTVATFLMGIVLRHAAEGPWSSVLPLLLRRTLLSLLHPVALSALLTALTVDASGYSFAQYLGPDRSVVTAGGLLMAFLAPAVVALGVLLYRKRALLQAYGVEVVLTLMAAAPLSLFSSALLARLLEIGTAPALATLPRSVTTPVAIPIAELLAANPGITAALVIITGVLGAVFGRPLLDALGVHQPVARGLAVGASAHGIGTAALVEREPSAAAISGIAFALMAAFSALAVSLPVVYDALHYLVGLP